MSILKCGLAALALIGLAGCATAPAQAPANTASAPPTTLAQAIAPSPGAVPAAPADPLAQLKAFTLADLQAASVDAGAQNPPDVTAKQCYDYLISVIPTLPGFAPGQTVGAVLAFQHLRDLNAGLNASNARLKSLNLACAPLVLDAQATLNKLLAIGAGAAGVPGLTGLGSLLP